MLQEEWNSSTISIVSTLRLHALVAHVLSLAAPVYSRRNVIRRIRWSSQTLCAVTLSCVNTSHSAPSLRRRVDMFRAVVYRNRFYTRSSKGCPPSLSRELKSMLQGWCEGENSWSCSE